MKVFRAQVSSLESSKGFYMGSKSFSIILEHYDTSSMKIQRNLSRSLKLHENQWKSLKPVKIFEIRWKSSEDKKQTWNRAKFSIGTADRYLLLKHPCPEFHANPYDCMKHMHPFICLQTLVHFWTSLKFHAHLQRFMKILANLWNHENQ